MGGKDVTYELEGHSSSKVIIRRNAPNVLCGTRYGTLGFQNVLIISVLISKNLYRIP